MVLRNSGCQSFISDFSKFVLTYLIFTEPIYSHFSFFEFISDSIYTDFSSDYDVVDLL